VSERPPEWQPPEQPPEPPPPEQPPPEQPAPSRATSHPIRLVVDDDLRRSRLTVLFRYILAIPHYFWVSIWGYGMGVVVFFNWFGTLFKGQSPHEFHVFSERYVRYRAHLSAYLTLLANPYPGFFGRPGSYPIDLEIPPPARQNRWVTGFRLILAIPAFIFSWVFSIVTFIVALIAWFVALVIGRTPKGMRDLLAYCRRYRSQTDAYLYLLTDRYPSFAGPKA
jgi:hypothetical protein